MQLHGKIAVVTGASSGIGHAAAQALAGAGMSVVAVARRADRLEELTATTPGVHAHPADVSSDDDVAKLARRVENDFGACHVLVNNAGFSSNPRFRTAEDTADVWAQMDVNFRGVVRCMGALGPLLFASAPARVINVASVAGKLGIGPPGYVASKFAVVGFTEAVGRQWRRKGVAVCQLNPGFVRTEGFPQTQLRGTPIARLVGEPGTVAQAIVEVARSGRHERTVPRWYRPLVVARHALAPAYWAVVRRLPF